MLARLGRLVRGARTHALAAHRALETRGLLANVRACGEALRSALYDRFANDPHVGDIRGRGLFQGLELVADRETKQTFDPLRNQRNLRFDILT